MFPRPVLRRGFTLIELLAVVTILVVLAGIVLPKVDRFHRRSATGVAAATMADVSRVLQTHFMTRNVYPDGFDSLIDAAALDLWRPGPPESARPGLAPNLVGGPPAGSAAKLVRETLENDNQVRSLTSAGIAKLFDADGTAPQTDIPGSLFTIPRTLAPGGLVASVNAADPKGLKIIQRLYPQTGAVPSFKKLVVLGFGPRNSAVGSHIQEVPFCPTVDANRYYHRYLAVFEISRSGFPAELKAVLGADGERLDEAVGGFFHP